MAQFMPTFNSSSSKVAVDKIEYATDADDMLEDDVTGSLQTKLVFSFIVDRSGSMGGSRIEIAKEALKLFMSSLPTGSFFQIISFGCNYQCMNLQEHNQGAKDNVYPYNNETKRAAQAQIEKFMNDFGGTEIYQPI